MERMDVDGKIKKCMYHSGTKEEQVQEETKSKMEGQFEGVCMNGQQVWSVRECTQEAACMESESVNQDSKYGGL